MEENKKIEAVTEEEEQFDIADAVKADKKSRFKLPKSPKKERRIKNQALFRKGGYSLAITAIVIAGVILFNVLVSALADRFVLEFDMTTDIKNSNSAENIEYIKNID